MEIFHGGCHGCISQDQFPIERCAGCQYFDADWSLPDLSIKPEDIKRKERQDIIRESARKMGYLDR